MIVRLHNLSARAPVMEDIRAVTSLLAECDAVEIGIADPKEEDVRKIWQAAGFNLKTDAWVIVSRAGQVVGYADVRPDEDGQWSFSTYVHPEYRSRGIGTLLTWLVEERARQMMEKRSSRGPMTLSIAISDFNQAAQGLLEREGYVLARHFWRLLIEMDEAVLPESDKGSEKGKIRMDLVVDAQNLMGATPLARRTGMYVARQYHVYEKVLHAEHDLMDQDQQEMQCAAV